MRPNFNSWVFPEVLDIVSSGVLIIDFIFIKSDETSSSNMILFIPLKFYQPSFKDTEMWINPISFQSKNCLFEPEYVTSSSLKI